ncbi:hypothetical protein J4419_03120 [Candidatus Woesearchaeota archaeon]|nr:hypothetical protein [Candidatus Woesearchaeota archaeon]
METVFDDLVKALGQKDENYVFGASKGHDSQQADFFFSRYYKKKRKKGFGTKIIFNEDMRSNQARTAIFKEAPNQCRFLHQETYAEINTYKNIVLFVMLFRKPIVIRIKSEEAAQSFRSYFESLWKQASSK